MVIDGGLKLGVLGGLAVPGAVKHLGDKLIVALGLDKFRDGPIDFVFRQRLPLLQRKLAESLLLELGALSHDCCQVQVRR